MTGRADTNKSRPKGNIGRLEEWGQTPAHKTARDYWCYNPTIFHSLAEIPQNAPEKF